MGKIMRTASEGIGKGGGHPVGAGAKVKDIEEFKKRVLKLLQPS